MRLCSLEAYMGLGGKWADRKTGGALGMAKCVEHIQFREFWHCAFISIWMQPLHKQGDAILLGGLSITLELSGKFRGQLWIPLSGIWITWAIQHFHFPFSGVTLVQTSQESCLHSPALRRADSSAANSLSPLLEAASISQKSTRWAHN